MSGEIIIEAINLRSKAGKIEKLFDYGNIIARINGHNSTLIKGEQRTLDFHFHPDSDEVFFVIEGSMKIEFREKVVELKEMDMIVVHRGLEHRPVCEGPVTCLLMELEGTLNEDNTGGAYKK